MLQAGALSAQRHQKVLQHAADGGDRFNTHRASHSSFDYREERLQPVFILFERLSTWADAALFLSAASYPASV